MSRAESIIRQLLDTNGIPYECQKTFPDLRTGRTQKRLAYDFFIPSLNLLIEYDGAQHLKHVKFFHKTRLDFDRAQQYDQFKNQYAIANGYILERISYKQIREIPTILQTLIPNLV